MVLRKRCLNPLLLAKQYFILGLEHAGATRECVKILCRETESAASRSTYVTGSLPGSTNNKCLSRLLILACNSSRSRPITLTGSLHGRHLADTSGDDGSNARAHLLGAIL